MSQSLAPCLIYNRDSLNTQRMKDSNAAIRGLEKHKLGKLSNQFIKMSTILHLLHCRHLFGHRAGEECLLKLEFGSWKHHCHRQELSARSFLQGSIKLVTRGLGHCTCLESSEVLFKSGL